MLCNFAAAQGIQFEQGLSWQQILEKAKSQNKYIFIDANATWCMPCKKMDREVFSKSVVGTYMNQHFVSVKIQMDSSKNDDNNIKGWYSFAHKLQQAYNISSLPTYLFFSPDGRIVHRYLSAMSDSLFLKVANNALNPEKQYYTLLSNYLSGKKDYKKLSYLASLAKEIGDDSLANKLATDFLHNYLNHFSDKELFQKSYFEFVYAFSPILSSKDRIFRVLYNYASQYDEIIGKKGIADAIVNNVIMKEEINQRLWPQSTPISSEPNWNKLASSISNKYSKHHADIIILDAQLKWYTQKKDWQQLIKYKVKQIDEYGLDTAGLGWVFINNFAWNYVYKFCNDKDTLEKAAAWMEVILKGHPDDYISIDTYANLLFKAGKKNEAIRWQTRAVHLELQAAKEENRAPNPGFKETLDRMKRNNSAGMAK